DKCPPTGAAMHAHRSTARGAAWLPCGGAGRRRSRSGALPSCPTAAPGIPDRVGCRSPIPETCLFGIVPHWTPPPGGDARLRGEKHRARRFSLSLPAFLLLFYLFTASVMPSLPLLYSVLPLLYRVFMFFIESFYI